MLGIFSYLIFIIIILNIIDYLNYRSRLIYYLKTMQIDNFYRKWVIPNSHIKNIINKKISPQEKMHYIFLKRFLFAIMKYNKLFKTIKKYHIKKSYNKSENVYSVRLFLVLNSLYDDDLEQNLIELKQEVLYMFKDNNNIVVFNIDVLD